MDDYNIPYLKIIAWTLGILFIGSFVYIGWYKATAPVMADAERQVFTNTQSYVGGKQQLLETGRLQYESSHDPQEKAALRTYMLKEAATVDRGKLTPEMQSFLNSLD